MEDESINNDDGEMGQTKVKQVNKQCE